MCGDLMSEPTPVPGRDDPVCGLCAEELLAEEQEHPDNLRDAHGRRAGPFT